MDWLDTRYWDWDLLIALSVGMLGSIGMALRRSRDGETPPEAGRRRFLYHALLAGMSAYVAWIFIPYALLLLARAREPYGELRAMVRGSAYFAGLVGAGFAACSAWCLWRMLLAAAAWLGRAPR